jgi:late competence protein required for DNA uptake (superfamily II DNA/RNA helicase)
VPENLVKIVLMKSMSQGVMVVRVSTLSRRHVRESVSCPSACLCEDPLQLKRVTSCCCLVLGATKGLDGEDDVQAYSGTMTSEGEPLQ